MIGYNLNTGFLIQVQNQTCGFVPRKLLACKVG